MCRFRGRSFSCNQIKNIFSRRLVFPIGLHVRRFEFATAEIAVYILWSGSDKVNILAAPCRLLVLTYICVHTYTGWRYASVNIVEKCIKGKHMHSKEVGLLLPSASPLFLRFRSLRHTSTFSYEPEGNFANPFSVELSFTHARSKYVSIDKYVLLSFFQMCFIP